MKVFKLDDEIRGMFGGTGRTFRDALENGEGNISFSLIRQRNVYVLNGLTYLVDNRQLRRYQKNDGKFCAKV